MKNYIKKYESFPQVKAIAIGGSGAGGTNNRADKLSDLDIYVFVTSDIPVEDRENLIKKISSKYEVGCEYFGSGDEYFVDKLNIQFDVMFWNVNWFSSVVENKWVKHYPSNGYTTAFLFTLNNFDIIYDPENWLYNLKKSVNSRYPEELKSNIIKRNLMLLKDKPFASYYEQIEKAIKREDIVSVNHRIAEFLSSYFDIIFAKNELLHPGEKRLIKYACDNCSILPKDFEKNIKDLLHPLNDEILETLNKIIDNLRDIL